MSDPDMDLTDEEVNEEEEAAQLLQEISDEIEKRDQIYKDRLKLVEKEVNVWKRAAVMHMLPVMGMFRAIAEDNDGIELSKNMLEAVVEAYNNTVELLYKDLKAVSSRLISLADSDEEREGIEKLLKMVIEHTDQMVCGPEQLEALKDKCNDNHISMPDMAEMSGMNPADIKEELNELVERGAKIGYGGADGLDPSTIGDEALDELL